MQATACHLVLRRRRQSVRIRYLDLLGMGDRPLRDFAGSRYHRDRHALTGSL